MRHGAAIFLCAGIMLLSGCASNVRDNSLKNQLEETSPDVVSGPEAEQLEDKEERGEAETEPDETVLDDTVYVGEYLDENEDATLEIAKGEDGKYIVQIGIFRLTFIDNGVGELTADGMKFTATDAAGNPVSGVITVEGETAAVTFTDSTWEYIKNGDSYVYTKSSDVPHIYVP